MQDETRPLGRHEQWLAEGSPVAEHDTAGWGKRPMVTTTTVARHTPTQVITATGRRFRREGLEMVGTKQAGRAITLCPMDDVFVQICIRRGDVQEGQPPAPITRAPLELKTFERWFARGNEVVEMENRDGVYYGTLTTVTNVTKNLIVTTTGRRFRRSDHFQVGEGRQFRFLSAPGAPQVSEAIARNEQPQEEP